MIAPAVALTIVDASVGLKWVCDEDGSDRAAALLDGRALAAPSFWLVEAANALWRRVQRGELAVAEADERILALSAAPVRLLNAEELLADALQWACDLGQPIYDCLYLAAALRSNGRVVTADRRFHAAAIRHPVAGAAIAPL